MFKCKYMTKFNSDYICNNEKKEWTFCVKNKNMNSFCFNYFPHKIKAILETICWITPVVLIIMLGLYIQY